MLESHYSEMVRIRVTLSLLALSAAAVPAAKTGDPNFSGAWRLDRESSETAGLPSAPADILKIRHEGVSVWCVDQPEWGEWTFTLDRKETRTRSGPLTLSSIGKWEGDAILINTIVNGPGISYTQADRWKLSRDGYRLTIRREIVRPGSRPREVVLAYDREDAGDAPEQAPGHAPAAAPAEYRVERGTRIPLTLLNSISTKQSAAGDRIYLETAFPIVVQGRVVIPPGSYVSGTLTFVKRPGRVAGRGELYLRFDSVTLPNGVTRDFRARPSGADADIQGEMDRGEGKIRSESNRVEDAKNAGEAAAAGASAGAIAGSAAGRPGLGTAIGGAAGAAAGAMAVLLSRGPDVVLARGTTIEMVLDRRIVFTEAELNR